MNTSLEEVHSVESCLPEVGGLGADISVDQARALRVLKEVQVREEPAVTTEDEGDFWDIYEALDYEESPNDPHQLSMPLSKMKRINNEPEVLVNPESSGNERALRINEDGYADLLGPLMNASEAMDYRLEELAQDARVLAGGGLTALAAYETGADPLNELYPVIGPDQIQVEFEEQVFEIRDDLMDAGLLEVSEVLGNNMVHELHYGATERGYDWIKFVDDNY